MDFESKYNKLSKNNIEKLLNKPLSDTEYRDLMQSSLYQLYKDTEESK